MDPGGTTFAASVDTIGSKAGGTHMSVDSLLAAGKPDMAIVTMIAAHAPDVIRPLLEAGVHVMAEKPACVNGWRTLRNWPVWPTPTAHT